MPPDPSPQEPAADARLQTLAEQLTPLVYEELRRTARRERRRLAVGDTLATTALLHESCLRLFDGPGFASRTDLLRVMAIVMRRVLIDRVRAQLARKRGGGAERVPLSEAEDLEVDDDERIALVDEALEQLAQVSPRLAQIVECRFFAGYTEKETAEALGLSERTVQRDWATARAWLQTRMEAPPEAGAVP